MPPATMFGYTPPGVQAAPPVPCRVAMALVSVFGSGGRSLDSGATGCGPTPAAHGLPLTAELPAVRYDVVTPPHAGVTWPDSSYPSEQMALVEPEVAPPTQA